MSQGPIKSLVYISTAKAGLRDGDIAAIVETARRNNQQRNITGLLAFNGTNFIQLLEGAAQDVTDCMAIISADPRHDGVVVLNKIDKPSREFPDWHMANLVIQVQGTLLDVSLEQILRHESVSRETYDIFRNFSSLGSSNSKPFNQ